MSSSVLQYAAPMQHSAPVQQRYSSEQQYAAPMQYSASMQYSAPVQQMSTPMRYSAPMQYAAPVQQMSATAQQYSAPMRYSAPGPADDFVRSPAGGQKMSTPMQQYAAPMQYSGPEQQRSPDTTTIANDSFLRVSEGSQTTISEDSRIQTMISKSQLLRMGGACVPHMFRTCTSVAVLARTAPVQVRHSELEAANTLESPRATLVRVEG